MLTLQQISDQPPRYGAKLRIEAKPRPFTIGPRIGSIVTLLSVERWSAHPQIVVKDGQGNESRLGFPEWRFTVVG